MGLTVRRSLVAGLAVAGILDSLYMLGYHGGLIPSLVCPFFGSGCDRVGRSRHAVHFGVPNAGVGAVGYAVMAALALWAGRSPPREKPLQALGLTAVSTAALGASAFLTWEQPKKVGAWCFWCLTSAAINVTIWALAVGDARRALCEWRSRAH